MNELERALVSGAAFMWVTFSLAACGGGFDEVPAMAPLCRDGRLVLIEDLGLERDVDYLGDYENGVLLGSKGTLCSGALQVERCEEAFELASMANGHARALITTEGDTARLWGAQSVISLFGEIDTVSEAVYVAASLGYAFDCTMQVTVIQDGFRITTAGVTSGGCAGTPFPADRLEVTRQGVVSDGDSGATITTGMCAGRGGF